MEIGGGQIVDRLNFLGGRTISFGDNPEGIASFYHMGGGQSGLGCLGWFCFRYHSAFLRDFQCLSGNNEVVFFDVVGLCDAFDGGVIASCDG